MRLLLLVSGVLVLLLTLVDVVWTTLGTHGGGPVSKHFTSMLWKLARAVRPRHRLLSFAGSAILVSLIVFWVGCVWLGWVLVYSSDPQSLADAHTRQRADLAGRIYFVAYSMSSMGNGDFQPQGSGWRLVTSVCTLSGIGSVTLAITFLLEVLTAVVHKRSLAAYISDLGGTPRAMLERAWSGERFEAVDHHFVQLTNMLHLYAEQHLAYPVLHYFHAEQKRTSSTLRVAALHETVLLMSEGAAPEKRIAPMLTGTLRSAMSGFAGVMQEEKVEPAEEPPAAPPLEILRGLGIPAVDEDAFARAVHKEEKLRRSLLGMLRQDAWTWEEMMD